MENAIKASSSSAAEVDLNKKMQDMKVSDNKAKEKESKAASPFGDDELDVFVDDEHNEDDGHGVLKLVNPSLAAFQKIMDDIGMQLGENQGEVLHCSFAPYLFRAAIVSLTSLPCPIFHP